MKKMISFEADTKFRQDQMLRMKKNESRVRKRQRNRKSHTVATNKKQLRFQNVRNLYDNEDGNGEIGCYSYTYPLMGFESEF